MKTETNGVDTSRALLQSSHAEQRVPVCQSPVPQARCTAPTHRQISSDGSGSAAFSSQLLSRRGLEWFGIRAYLSRNVFHSRATILRIQNTIKNRRNEEVKQYSH